MTLRDRILDEAEALALNMVLNDPTDSEILMAVGEIVGTDIHPKSVGAHLALAAYNRAEKMRAVA